MPMAATVTTARKMTSQWPDSRFSGVASGLRGAQTAKAPARPAAAPTQIARTTPPPTSDASTYSTDPGQCREGCAHTYYFCLAGEDAPSCPQNWSSCLIS